MSHAVRIITALGNHGLAVREDRGGHGPENAFEVRFRRSVGRPLPGDRVSLDDSGAVTAILPRASVFGRGVRGRFRPVAANLDRLLVVIAAEPAPSRALLHRYLAAARIQDVATGIVVNKTDLPLPDASPFCDLHELQDLGVTLYRTRAAAPVVLDDLPASMGSGIHLLAGQSGVGKTSLVNALVPDRAGQTEALSRSTGKGRHTTTGARLLRVPEGGWLVDTPGVWEYELWRMTPQELALGFPEFARLASRCRFRDCRHGDEPGCAVREAAAAGKLPASRLGAWHDLMDEQRRLAEH
jgi:ribosome biogenesis GTPase